MKFEVTILGCGSATPTLRHGPTAQVVNHDEHFFLLDCGEGTQLQLRRFGIKFQRINHIFITHLHGDHCLGLPGLLSTMHLLGRTKTLHIYANAALKPAIELQLKASYSRLRYPLEWHDLSYDGPKVIMENSKLEVMSFPLNHKVPCCGFRISEKPRQRKMRPELIEKYNIPVARIRQIKQGMDYKLDDGKVITNAELTLDPPASKSYAFCTDTAYTATAVEAVRNVDLLYHESTFIEADRQRAYDTFHSTSKDAARVATEANARKLVLGHYSARYSDLTPFMEEASTIFENVMLADEGLSIKV